VKCDGAHGAKGNRISTHGTTASTSAERFTSRGLGGGRVGRRVPSPNRPEVLHRIRSAPECPNVSRRAWKAGRLAISECSVDSGKAEWVSSTRPRTSDCGVA
jgi:hypothetical protein